MNNIKFLAPVVLLLIGLSLNAQTFKKCSNGHYYQGKQCPYCPVTADTVPAQQKSLTGASAALSPDTVNPETARQLISFINDFQLYNNEQSKAWNVYEQQLSVANSKIENYKKNTSASVSAHFSVYRVPLSCYEKYEESFARTPEFAEKADFTYAVAKARDNVNKLDASFDRLQNYFNLETYKTDTDFHDFNALKETIATQTNDSRNAWLDAMYLATDIGDRMQISMLSQTKASPFVLPMKSDIQKASKICRQFYKLVQNQPADFSTLIPMLAQFDNSVLANAPLEGKDVSLINNQTADYMTFYYKAQEFSRFMSLLVGEYQAAQLDATSIEYYHNQMNTFFNDMKSTYNQFLTNTVYQQY
jgi:hypothetical protein